MSKNIVICLDGTWNGPDRKDPSSGFTPTNVQKVFEDLSGSAPLGPTENEKEVSFTDAVGSVVQVAKYIHGVGDTSNVLAEKAEGAFGLGLIARIARGYTYLSRQYQPGDHIYILGFSRGAYTARALAGFVAGKGLLDWAAMQLVAGSKPSYSAGIAAWQQYKKSLHCNDPGILHTLAECFTDVADKLEMGMGPMPPLKFVIPVPVLAVGVWETVGALGIPDFGIAAGKPIRRDVFEFADTALSGSVANGFHAVAVDEQRVDFTPTLWDTREGVVQVLFPGAHSDVGGGYASDQSGLSSCALIWMAARLSAVGLLLANLTLGKPNPLDIAHQPWTEPGAKFVTAQREFPPTLGLSQRVLQRIAGGALQVQSAPNQPYRPQNLLNSYIKLDWTGPAPHTQVEI
jgi:uncharacterized protein (DUF2235 family)